MNILTESSKLTRLIQSHKGFTPFNYDLCVDWAIDLLEKGIITNNVEILASFSKPTNAWEVRPYVYHILNEFNLEEFEGEKAVQSKPYYYVWSILNNNGEIIAHLETLCSFCIESDYEESTFPFYLLKYSWEDLKDFGMSCHYESVTLKNFHDIVLKEAEIWMGNFERLK